MSLIRPTTAPAPHRRSPRAFTKRPRSDVRRFGRGRQWQLLQPAVRRASPIGSDLKLFATTFLAGFVFVSVLIA